MGAKKISLPAGKKKKSYLFGLIKREMPVYKTQWQKSAQTSMFNEVFSPQDYNGRTYEEQKNRAYEDAENYLSFYKELIANGILPPSTKVKIKRLRHTDAYHLEFWMPHIRDLEGMESVINAYGTGRGKFKEKVKAVKEGIDKKQKEIREIAKKFGYNDRFNDDIYAIRNYGYDKEGILRLHDVHVLSTDLPNTHRKRNTKKRFWYDEDATQEERDKRRRRFKTLESSVETVLLTIIVTGIIVLLLNNFKITGGVIGSPNNHLDVYSLILISIGVIALGITKKICHK